MNFLQFPYIKYYRLILNQQSLKRKVLKPCFNSNTRLIFMIPLTFERKDLKKIKDFIHQNT